jgi:amino acid transporter/mannitol/fructose-specific phosphotransferase system IIA component (Ntr-type)
MFSSGFFLLPGLATAKAGPAAVLAYLLAGVLILPAMFSQAELSTAMPKAGGTYYFLDRSLGPLAGTVGGLGTWLALVLKSAFALIGMGAYLVFFLDIPVKPLAVGLTVGFAILNIVGAKETSSLQRWLVAILVGVLVFFVVQGLAEVVSLGSANLERQFDPFAPFGLGSLVSTIGLVFVSYAGLTKVASVAEEVQNPDRNIPLGMILSLVTATALYVVGVFILVAVLDPAELRSDLTPIATAAESFFSWLPGRWGLLLVVVAAIAAFASTGNAGILSASRYPMAMARDLLVTPRLAVLGKSGTPTTAIVVTALLMIVAIVALDVEGLAKLASAFQLVIFALVNVAVLVMRESHIPSYVPGYRSPLYPWMQIAGIVAPIVLITQMGTLALGLTGLTIALSLGWYAYYVQPNPHVDREGAIYHLFARLGQRRYDRLDEELRTILKEKEMGDHTPFETLVTQSVVIDAEAGRTYESVVREAAERLAGRVGQPADVLAEGLLEGARFGATPVIRGAALPHQRVSGLDHPHLALVRSRTGLNAPAYDLGDASETDGDKVFAVFVLVSPYEPPGQHLRTLAALASRIDEDGFLDRWRHAPGDQALRETLITHDRFLALVVSPHDGTSDLVGKQLRELRLPEGVLVALVHRAGQLVVPSGTTQLEAGDRLTIIGETDGIRDVARRFAP